MQGSSPPAQMPQLPQPAVCPPGVYAFGFLFMLPQLFVNYKVRLWSVHTLAFVSCAAIL